MQGRTAPAPGPQTHVLPTPAITGAARGETLPLLPTHQQPGLYAPCLALLLGPQSWSESLQRGKDFLKIPLSLHREKKVYP